MADIIKHRGIVEKIDGAHIVVRIVQTSACSACSAKGLCNASESKEKQIDVYEAGASYRIGEEVVLIGSTSMGMKAVMFAFGIPLLLIFIAIFVAMKVIGLDELVSSLVVLIAVIPYYIILYLKRDKFNKTFSFTIEK